MGRRKKDTPSIPSYQKGVPAVSWVGTDPSMLRIHAGILYNEEEVRAFADKLNDYLSAYPGRQQPAYVWRSPSTNKRLDGKDTLSARTRAANKLYGPKK